MADFCLVSRRTLSDHQYLIFTWHFLHGADWKSCCQRLKIDRGTFFHEVYRIEEKLGKTFRELEPHSLFPIDEYFNSTGREKEAVAGPQLIEAGAQAANRKTITRFPLKRVA